MFDTGYYSNARAAAINTAMSKVFGTMGLGLLVTALVAMFTASSPAMLAVIFGNVLIKWIVLLAPLGFVLAMGLGYEKFSASTLKTLFFTYSAINGLSLSAIMIVYTVGSLFAAFFSSAAIFGIMAGYGYFTKKDLTSWGKLLMFALIGIIIAMVINLFIGSSALTTLISCVAVVVFMGLTAYDTQTIRQTLTSETDNSKAVTMGALTLYLDFLNLFLNLLQLLGVKKD